jgi:GDP-L-fucose synthase
MYHYDRPDPINIGGGPEISMLALAEMVKDATEYRGSIVWDPSKPNGQPRRRLATERAERELGFRPKMKLPQGLALTAAWWRAQKAALSTTETGYSEGVT